MSALSAGHRPEGSARRGRSIVPAIGVVAVLALLVGGGLAGSTPPLRASLVGAPASVAPPSTSPPTWNLPGPASGTCNPSTPTPSSIFLPQPDPSTSVSAGGSLGVVYELQVVNSTIPSGGVTVYVPATFAQFSLAGGSSASLYLAPRSLVVTTTGWSSPSFANHSASFASGLAFAPRGTATLSTEKLAVMGTASYGKLTVEFRWQWYVTGSSGTTTGPWTVPNGTSHWPTSMASRFFPAPYLSLVSSAGPAVLIGQNVTSTLGGAVGSAYVFQELENSSTGKVFQAGGARAPAGATQFTVGISMLNYDHYLYPGTYLLHLHDGCGAMLYSLSKTASYAPNATVSVVVSPSSCGPVPINGTSHASGTRFSIRPSATPYSFSVPSCTGHAFRAWSGSGGIHVAGTGQLQVSASGTFTVQYT